MGTLLSRRDLEAKLSLSRSAVARLVSAPRFPAPITIGSRNVRWFESEVDEWLQRQPRKARKSLAHATAIRGRKPPHKVTLPRVRRGLPDGHGSRSTGRRAGA